MIHSSESQISRKISKYQDNQNKLLAGQESQNSAKRFQKRGETAPKSPVARNNFNSSVSQRMGEDFCRKEEEDEENRSSFIGRKTTPRRVVDVLKGCSPFQK